MTYVSNSPSYAAFVGPRTGPVNYCHNCRCREPLPDGVYCEYCLTFFYGNGRLPRPGDNPPPTDALSRALRELEETA